MITIKTQRLKHNFSFEKDILLSNFLWSDKIILFYTVYTLNSVIDVSTLSKNYLKWIKTRFKIAAIMLSSEKSWRLIWWIDNNNTFRVCCHGIHKKLKVFHDELKNTFLSAAIVYCALRFTKKKPDELTH